MGKTKIILSPTRDRDILMFIWKWKVATTSAIHHKYFPNTTFFNTYCKLNRLRSGGFITAVPIEDSSSQRVWTLTGRGFNYVKNHLPGLREDGFKSECVWHDLMTSSFQITGFATHPPDNATFLSEQVLRRINLEILPSYLPKPDRRRPDGYSIFENQKNRIIIAIEVELNQKSDARYEEVVDFYHWAREISHVFWLIKNLGIAKKIIHLSQKLGDDRFQIHNFCLLDEYLVHAWDSKFRYGPFSGKTIDETYTIVLNKLQENGRKPYSGSFMHSTRLSTENDSGKNETIEVKKLRL